MEPLNKLLEIYGNKAECARALGITPQRLNAWFTKGFIPYKNGDMVQEKTKGKVKASAVWQAASKRN